eukprot:s434_g11.t1
MQLCLFFWCFAIGSASHLPFAALNVHSAASSDACEMRSGAGVAAADNCWGSLDTLLVVSAVVINSGEQVISPGSPGLCGQRLGEATHPGPLDLLTVGTTNPGGLRQKEPLAIEQGGGIWSYSETHLSGVTQKSSTRALKACARQDNRHLRVHHGAPAPLRSRSDWAGTYTGVTTTSDFCSKKLQVEWPQDVWESGRVLATQHFVGRHVITVINIYGLPRGPTWPKAAALTNDILEFVTKQFVIGYQGLIIINGDFNFSPHELPCFDVWRAYGFVSAQQFAFQRWGQEVQHTCKGSTERDLLWMSPLTSSLCHAVNVAEIFQDHASVSVQLSLDFLQPTLQTWPRPREIPWEKICLQEWHQHCDALQFQATTDSTQMMSDLAHSFESSLTGFVNEFPSAALSSLHCGRAKRLVPEKVAPSPKTCKASRPGEIHLAADTIGNAVLAWFKQMRRIQSYKHAICAGQQHPDAVRYRLELWSAIRRARGFAVSFEVWWMQQDFAAVLGPLPLQPPPAPHAVMIFQAFHHAFRAFERWHLQQKQQVLQAKYDKTMKALFNDLRKPRPDQVDSFWETLPFDVVAINAASNSVLLHQPLPDNKEGTWFLHGHPLAVRGHVEELLVFHELPALSVGDSLDFHCHTANIEQVHQCLADFWTPRWSPAVLHHDEVWHRMTNFVNHFMPKIPLVLPPLTIDMWTRALKRFKPQAARGADGWARLDLLNMSPAHMSQLLNMLMAIEAGAIQWPAQLLEGLVIAIAKCDEAHRPNEFRPIVLLSVIYRAWASLRSRQMLVQLEPHIHADAHGFLPTREPGQTWLQVQAAVEVAVQSSQPLAGIGTDFVKAFNCIKRAPLWCLAEAIGIPLQLLHPWRNFVNNFTRRFMVCNQVSDAYLSTCGFAEGCPLSVLAMAMVDWGFQVYQMHFAPRVRHFSFVDNISMLAQQAHCVAWAFFTLRTFLTMWGLTVDLEKTYA